MSRIARDELASIIEYVLTNDAISGPVNSVSPNPVRNAEFAAVLSRVSGRKPGLAIPTFLLRLMLGEMAQALILASRQIVPSKLLAAGYPFQFPELEVALGHELVNQYQTVDQQVDPG